MFNWTKLVETFAKRIKFKCFLSFQSLFVGLTSIVFNRTQSKWQWMSSSYSYFYLLSLSLSLIKLWIFLVSFGMSQQVTHKHQDTKKIFVVFFHFYIVFFVVLFLLHLSLHPQNVERSMLLWHLYLVVVKSYSESFSRWWLLCWTFCTNLEVVSWEKSEV